MRAEDLVQAAIVEYVQTVAPQLLIYAIPNAAVRTPGGRAGNAVPGLKAGAFDLGLVLEDGRAAFIECKAAGGRVSGAQLGFKENLIKRRIPFAICRSIEDARAALAIWGVETREHEAA